MGIKRKHLKEGCAISLKRHINGTNKDRWKDPYAWDCLTDEQRDIINEWYSSAYSREEERAKKEITNHRNASFFGIIPFAVHYAYKWAGGALNLEFLWQLICALIVYSIIFFLFYEGYLAANCEPPSKLGLVWHMIIAILISLWVMFSVA